MLRSLPIVLFLVACGGAASVEPTTPRVEAPAENARALPLGAPVQARLAPSDPRNDGGCHQHRWTVAAEAGQRIRVAMRSTEVDALLEVVLPGGRRVRNDDFVGLDATVELVAEEAGSYEIWATTATAGQTGRYALEARAVDPAGQGDAYVLGDGFEGRLAAPQHWLRFEGQAGSLVTLRVTSPDFDTTARLLGPDGRQWFNDDAHDMGPDGTESAYDSTVVTALPTSGVYQLLVGSYRPGATGGFRVRSEVEAPRILPASGGRPENLAGPALQGRILGVYFGITDYPQGPLYGCADDASLLAESMRAARLQNEADQRVFRDRDVTRERLLSELRSVAGRATENDVVLVFYSGHGNQVPAPEGSPELDGQDEALALVDGRVTDDEVVEALSGLRAATSILALDACNSGGFAEDWVTAPNRIGLFSSDADVLSDTAEPHRAGGYLSWHLRRAVLGEADARPRDGVLHAGELTDYLYQGFVEDFRAMNPEHATDPHQVLVSRRGGVTWDTLLWVYGRNPDFSLPPIPDRPLTSAPPAR
jgi:hypothetical protein